MKRQHSPLSLVLITLALLGVLGGSSIVAQSTPVSGEAAASPKASRIVVVLSSDSHIYTQVAETLLRELGSTAASSQRLLLRTSGILGRDTWKPDGDLVVAIGSAAATAVAKSLHADLPLVYAMVADPESAGLVGRALTSGVSAAVTPEAQLSLIQEGLPATRSVGMLYRRGVEKSAAGVEQYRQALPEGWALRTVALEDHESFVEATEALLNLQPGVIAVSPDSSVYKVATLRSLLLESLRRRVPVSGYSTPLVRAGALLASVIDTEQHAIQAAEVVNAALSENPRWQHLAPRFQISLNLIVARRLELQLPEGLIGRAHHVFRSTD